MSNIIYSFNKNFIIFTFHMQHQRSNAHETADEAICFV